MRKGKRVNPQDHNELAKICKECHKKYVERYILHPFWAKSDAAKQRVDKAESEFAKHSDKLSHLSEQILRIKQGDIINQENQDGRVKSLKVDKTNLVEEMRFLQEEIDNKNAKGQEQEAHITSNYELIKVLDDKKSMLLLEEHQENRKLKDMETECSD